MLVTFHVTSLGDPSVVQNQPKRVLVKQCVPAAQEKMVGIKK